jgi:hypothetical protein
VTPESLLQLARAYQPSAVLFCAVKFGLFQILGKKTLTAGEVAQAAQLSPVGVERLLNALVTADLITLQRGRYRNTPFGKRYLADENSPLHHTLRHEATHQRVWSLLEESVRRGTALLSVMADEGERAAARESYMGAMGEQAALYLPKVLKILSIKKMRRLLDVGIGPAVFAVGFARANPRLVVTGLDLPHILPLSRRNIERAGLEGRVHAEHGDYLRDPFPGGQDAVWLSQIVHSNTAEQCQMLIHKAAGAIEPGGKVAIFDYLMDGTRTRPVAGVYFSLVMLLASRAGQTQRVQDLRRWMADAGLTPGRAVPLTNEQSILVGEKKRARRIKGRAGGRGRSARPRPASSA